MTEAWWFMPDTHGGRGLISLGADWANAAFFDESYISPRYGKLDTSKMDLRFNPDQKSLPRYDFVSTMPPTCRMEVFRLFEPLIGTHVVTFPVSIEGVPYVVFRPKTFLDLIDMNGSEYMILPSGTPYYFTSIKLRALPEQDTPIFGLSKPQTVRQSILVNSTFKEIYESNLLTGRRFKKVYP